ncbi:MAG: ATP-dependent DNA helicase RecG [Peptococcaceae bacterium]|nr:ATP-dependent DNA helicase RecG [Candidatus Syntrophopropionicum ammoniitolerans]
MQNNLLLKPVQSIKTIGPRRAASLQKLGIFTVGDLLSHFPRRYEDRTHLRSAGTLVHDETATIGGKVLAAQDLKPRRGLTITKLAVHDGFGVFYAVWFNQPFIRKRLPPGTKIYITGKVDKGYGATQLMVEDYEVDNGGDSLSAGRLVPVYPLTDGLNQRQLRLMINTALAVLDNQIDDFLPGEITEKYNLPRIGQALQQIHFPDGEKEARGARKRFIFEEFFLLQLVLAMRKREINCSVKSYNYLPPGKLLHLYQKNLPFQLTGGQRRVWREISADLDGSRPLHRLLQGDVGAGKTVISTMTMLRAVESGLQAALMAPTEILAEQHYLGLSKDLAAIGVEVGLLTSGTRKKERERLLARIAAGELKLLVGTHALLQGDVSFQRLGLVVVDEQHRFGVRQRAALTHKGNLPDTLVMTATPIPRTLALTLYGDLDISVIGELPPGRNPVKTYAVLPRALPKALRLVKKQVSLGHQAYIVCPLVEESEKIDLQSAINLSAELAANEFKGLQVGLLHGRMKSAEKEETMSRFRQGEIKVLVSTTVIEVGLDIPNATVMLIIDADRFGLAQLHQLRGRVGRSSHQSYCILVADPKTDQGRDRLRVMTRTRDGFLLAEEDLRLRGPGEFHGTRQSGLPELKIADLLRDWKALEAARREAQALVHRDPSCKDTSSRAIFAEVKARFGKNINISGG